MTGIIADVLEPDVSRRRCCFRTELKRATPACEVAVPHGYVFVRPGLVERAIAAKFDRVAAAGRVPVFVAHGVDVTVGDFDGIATG